MKKFELTEETKVNRKGRTLHRIRACIDFTTQDGVVIKKGELGGWIEKEKNLSQSGKSWIYNNAEVFGSAKVYENAQVFGSAKVYENAQVCGNAKVCRNAKVYENAQVYGNAKVCGNAEVCENAVVFGNAVVYGNIKVCGNAGVCGTIEACNNENKTSAATIIPHHVKIKELKQKVKELELLIIEYCQFNIEKTNAIVCIEEAFKHVENSLKEAEVTQQN